MGGRILYPLHQNVLWSFLISIGLIHWNEKVKSGGSVWKQILCGAASVLLGSAAGLLTMVDFYHAGILTVMAFYFFRTRKWYGYLAQLICLYYINTEILGGLVYEFSAFGMVFTVPQQGFALLALLPIWLYRGRQGRHSKELQYFYYAFYPLHLLILGLLRIL